MKTIVKGKFDGKIIDIEITHSSAEECAEFVMEFYEGCLINTPNFMKRMEIYMPSLMKAIKHFQKSFK